MELKTKSFKDAPIKNYEREKYTFHIFLNLLITSEKFLLCEAAYENLKKKLVNAPVLAFPNYKKSFNLYVDGSKEREYKAILY
jgi:hypothetical protein